MATNDTPSAISLPSGETSNHSDTSVMCTICKTKEFVTEMKVLIDKYVRFLEAEEVAAEQIKKRLAAAEFLCSRDRVQQREQMHFE